MSLQFKPIGSSEPVYSPARDVAWFFEDVANLAAGTLESSQAKTWLANFIAENRLTESSLQNTHAAYMEGIREFRNPAHEYSGQALDAGGFWKASEADRIGVLAAVGLIMTNYYFKAVREGLSTPYAGDKPRIVMASPETVEAIAAGNATLKRDQRRLDELEKAQEAAARAHPEYAKQREQSGRVGW